MTSVLEEAFKIKVIDVMFLRHLIADGRIRSSQ